DYGVLVVALAAVGDHTRLSLILLAYFVAQLLAQIPLTPGGLGFVEAGLTGTLAIVGVSAGDALVATLAYRLVSYWLPIPIGGVAHLLFPRRYTRSLAHHPAPPPRRALRPRAPPPARPPRHPQTPSPPPPAPLPPP